MVSTFTRLTALILACAGLVSCGRSRSATEEERKRQKKEAIKQAVSEMIARNRAIGDWDNRFRDRLLNVYTTTVEDALKPADGRPIYVLTSIQDVVRVNGGYVVHFSSRDTFPEIRFALSADSEQVKEIERHASEFANGWGVVVSVSSVHKVKFGLEAKRDDEGGAEVEVSDPDLFIATGRCVDLMYVGD